MVCYLGTLRRFIGSTVLLTSSLLAGDKTPYRPQIPKTWVEAELEQMDVPVSQPAYSPKAVSPAYYYRIPVAPIYKSYPVYAPGRAPAGYLEKLKHTAPELAFDPARLKTKEDWIRAGGIVFDAPAAYDTEDARRLADNYVPTHFAVDGRKTRAVPGREFGRKLPDAEKKSLIAFLKAL